MDDLSFDNSRPCFLRTSVMIWSSSSWLRAYGLTVFEADATMMLAYLCMVSMRVDCRCLAMNLVSCSMVRSVIALLPAAVSCWLS